MTSTIDLLKNSNSNKQSIHRYGFLYDLLFSNVFNKVKRPLNVLEIGVSLYGESSFGVWADIDFVGRVVGIDIDPYIGKKSEKMAFYQMDAYDDLTIDHLMEVENTKFDIIIHDGIAKYHNQKIFLDNYIKLLSSDGYLICEDIGDLRLINEYASDDTAFIIDGWGNRGIEISSWTNDSRLYLHQERILIKAKDEKINAAQIHENKPHIIALPEFKVEDYDRTSTELAISVPLFHPEFKTFNVDRFKDVHCKGAIWAGLSFIKNSDLAENGVPLYFHIEDEVWDIAMEVFDKFNVPENWCRKMKIEGDRPERGSNTKPSFGKLHMALLDHEIDPEVLLILDSDFFTCVTDKKFALYKNLTNQILKNHPSMTYFKMKELPYAWYVGVVLLAAGFNGKLIYDNNLQELEKMAYKELGFEKEIDLNLKSNSKVNRFYSDNYIVTFPRKHPVRDFVTDRILNCYATPYLYAMWAEFNQPFIELSQALNIPIYDWESHYIEANRGRDCFCHMRVDKYLSATLTRPSLIHKYIDGFIEDLSRHVI